MALGGGAHAATIPFTDTFDSDPVGSAPPAGFTVGGGAIYSIVEQTSGDNALLGSVSGANSGSMAVSLTNAVGNPITLSTDAKLVSLASGTSPSANFGLGLFGSSANFSDTTTASQYRLLLTTVSGTVGGLSLVKTGTTLSGTNGGSLLSVAPNTDYTIAVTVTPVGGSLVFHATASDGTNTRTLDVTDATPLSGTFFGYRTATAGTGTNEAVQYDNFSVTLAPEPGALGVVAAGMMMLGRRRR
jgi:hypothetical protein